MDKIFEKINFLWGGAVAVLSMFFGEHWFLFLAFALLNIADYITGWIKARYFGIENSVKGLKGILKKVGYWLVIAISFFVALGFKDIGSVIGIELGFTVFIGWFTLCTFIINEIRSVLENLVQIGVEVPSWLVKGLEVANNKINDVADGIPDRMTNKDALHSNRGEGDEDINGEDDENV